MIKCITRGTKNKRNIKFSKDLKNINWSLYFAYSVLIINIPSLIERKRKGRDRHNYGGDFAFFFNIELLFHSVKKFWMISPVIIAKSIFNENRHKVENVVFFQMLLCVLRILFDSIKILISNQKVSILHLGYFDIK